MVLSCWSCSVCSRYIFVAEKVLLHCSWMGILGVAKIGAHSLMRVRSPKSIGSRMGSWASSALELKYVKEATTFKLGVLGLHNLV